MDYFHGFYTSDCCIYIYLYSSENILIPTDLQKDALNLQDKLEFDDAGAEGVKSHVDDEYKWVGVEDPKVMITTSRDPSSKLKQFAKVYTCCNEILLNKIFI